MDRGDAERLFQLLCLEGYLGERYERNGLGFTQAYVTTGPHARQLLQGGRKVEMGVSRDGGKSAAGAAKAPRARAAGGGRRSAAAAAKAAAQVDNDDDQDEEYFPDDDDDEVIVDEDARPEVGPSKAVARAWDPLARGRKANKQTPAQATGGASDLTYDKVFAELTRMRGEVRPGKR